MAFAEGAGDANTELRMIAAQTLGDIVIQTGNVKQLDSWQTWMNVRCHREFLFIVLIAETTHVTHDLQRVCIHSVDVEQVKLHLAEDAAEFRQVSTENAPAIHPAELGEQVVVAAQ